MLCQTQGLSVGKHMALHLSANFLQVLSAEVGQRWKLGSAYREVVTLGLLYPSCQF